MTDDPSNPTNLFDSPADQVEALRFPDDLRTQAKDLYAQTLPDGQSGGMTVTDLRLVWHRPSAFKTEGAWEKEEGWVVCTCALTHARFAVPEDEAVPALQIEYRFADGTESVFYRSVHPELAANRPKLAEQLVASLGRKIHDRLMDLIGAAAELKTLSEMEDVPGTGEEQPGGERADRCEYQPIDSARE